MVRWNEPRFLAEAEDWIRGQVSVNGPVEQVHVQQWSTVFRVPTTDGLVWFKASGDVHVFEPELIGLLSQHSPDTVPKVLAIHPAQKWMITSDAGSRLREIIDEVSDAEPWLAVLPLYAELQIAAMGQVDEFLALDVPHERLCDLPDRIAAILDKPAFLLIDRPDGLTSGQVSELSAAIPSIADLCAELDEVPIGESIQHDDLNDGNIFYANGQYRVMDWGDACVSHPFHSLTVQLRAAAYRRNLEPGGAEVLRMRDAYLEPFEIFAERDVLVETMGKAYRTGTLARAHAWYGYVSAGDGPERSDDVEAVPYGLKKFLENGPLGSWRD